jgi:hypothetical protein
MKTIAPEFEADSAAASALIAGAGMASGLPAGTEGALFDWVREALSRGVVRSRLGEMEEGAWALMHDDEVREVAERMVGG